ncbi:MAG: hypothetical protein ACRD5R_03725 [Candidatus Acidiferrales bacterium]
MAHDRCRKVFVAPRAAELALNGAPASAADLQKILPVSNGRCYGSTRENDQ